MAEPHRIALGIDIGGTGMKGAPVDLETGTLVADRFRIPTPTPATPQAMAAVVGEIAAHFDAVLPAGCPIGVTIPGLVDNGTIRIAANLDPSWSGCNAAALFSTELQRPCSMVNDADAAGVAELEFGAAKGEPGLVIMTTLGTGIGIAMLFNGVLIPNAELGHVQLDGWVAETRASKSAKEREGLSYKTWATERLQPYYSHLEFLLSPDLFIVGGGISKKSAKFLPRLKLRARIIPAELLNEAGIVGAATFAAKRAAGLSAPVGVG